MGVDCDSVAGYGFEITDDMFLNLIDTNKFNDFVSDRDEKEEYKKMSCQEIFDSFDNNDKDELLDFFNLYHGVAGSYYSGDLTYYSYVNPQRYQDIASKLSTLINEWHKYGVMIKESDIIFINDVIWS